MGTTAFSGAAGATTGFEETDLRNEQGLRAAHRAHAGELYRFALRGLGDRGAAEDVVQEVFLRAWRAADQFDARRGTLRGWLFAIARNLLVDHARRQSVRPAQPVEAQSLIALAGGDDGFAEATMTAWTVEEALRRLSEEHRVALVETYLRGRPYAEVSAELGVPVGTVRSRVFYGLKALRLVLDEMGVQL
jgi:RNA polymerase sigma-70 factor, ECF subfamily